MNIKHLSTLLLLSLTLLLTACVDEVSSENETIYGRFSAEEFAQDKVKSLVSETIDFERDSHEKAEFISGYTLQDNAGKGTLYVGVYKQSRKDISLPSEDWAKELQGFINRKDWYFEKYGENGESIFDSGFEVDREKASFVAVKVEYRAGEYWVYLAIPREMFLFHNEKLIKDKFKEYRIKHQQL